MSFFKYNHYNTSEVAINSSYKGTDNVIFAGRFKDSGLITAISENGVLQWNKAYNFADGRDLVFIKALPFSDNEHILVGIRSGKTPVIIRIKNSGDIIWSRTFPDITTSEKNLFAEIFIGNMIYLAYYDLNMGRSGTLLIDGEANVLSKKYIENQPGSYLQVTGIATYQEMVLLSANEVINNDMKRGVFMKGQVTVPVLESMYTQMGGAPIELNGIYCREIQGNYEIYLTGVVDGTPVLMTGESDQAIVYSHHPGQDLRFTFGNDYFYICNRYSEVTLSKYNFTHDWTKRVDLKGFMIDHVKQNKVVVRAEPDTDNYSGYMAGTIDSCRTTPVDNFQPVFREYQRQDAGYTSSDASSSVDYPDFILEDLSYEGENICDNGGGTAIPFNDLSGLQTPSFYLQAAGSKGEDSARGIHLRWAFGGLLGENHLPKGNMAGTYYNFNKPGDFVKIYRTPYVKSVFTLDFSTPPELIDDGQKAWIYKFNNGQRMIYVYFKNKNTYSFVRQSVDPFTEPLKFIRTYGNELIEIHCKTDMFFAATQNVTWQPGSRLMTEVLSTENSGNVSEYYLSCRRTGRVGAPYFTAENGKIIRFKPDNCLVYSVDFEFYSDFIISRNEEQAWTFINDFSLTLESERAYKELDPLPNENPVHGAWLRYNDNAFVNIENYKNRWEHSSQGPLDRDIRTVVEQYIKLSDEQANPKAYETIDFNFSQDSVNDPFVTISNDPPEPGSTQVANLDMLNIAALDYHVARMLGLGYLDIRDSVVGQEFIYIAEYYTNNDLDINASEKTYQLLSMSLPVSTDIERLPMPVDLMKLSKGMGTNNQNSSPLYDNEGYSHDGKFRYIGIHNQNVPDYEVNPGFFASSVPFDASQMTKPVYAGLEYRFIEPGKPDNYLWFKPELCHDTRYLNIDGTVNSDQAFETLPIRIPDNNDPMYMHKQDKTGTYFYKSYGISWFSRSGMGDMELSIETEIKPFNRLLPPSGVTAFNIQKEFPLTFTSKEEQLRLKEIGNTDKTLVRLLYDYYSYQDMMTYSIPFDSVIPDQDYLNDPNSLFPDDKEVFADEAEIYFRNYTPKIISAKAYEVAYHPNQLMATIRTQDYAVPGSGATVPGSSQPSIVPEYFKSRIPDGSVAADFIGGIFLMDSESYIIHEIAQGAQGLDFTVFKKVPSEAIIAGQTPVIDQTSLALPVISSASEGLFSATENLQNTTAWGVKNPNSLKVKIGTDDWTVHREIISVPQSGGTVQKYLEKSRGFWKNANIEPLFEKLYKYQNSVGTVIEYDVDNPPQVFQGVYKITFPGFSLSQHPQYSDGGHSAEWFRGMVRLFTNESYVDGTAIDSRSIFKVVKTEGIGTSQDLVLYIYDESFEIIEEVDSHLPILYTAADTIPKLPSNPLTGKGLDVNYYPSYKVYLYENTDNNLNEDNILPSGDEDVRYSIFGLRSVDEDNTDMQGAKYKSKFSIPAVMFANRIIEPKQPRKPKGSKYATRPDKFGKSTYSFITKYQQKPYSVQFFRANNTLMLAALYETETIREIKANLALLGGNEETFFNDRWMNFVDFEMLTSGADGYEILPETGDFTYQLPLPDSKDFFNAVNHFITEHNKYYKLVQGCPLIEEVEFGNVEFSREIISAIPGVSGSLSFGAFVKERLFNCFMPLTEVPVIYQHIKNLNLSDSLGHRPKNKKQSIRDASGYLLPTTHSDFDMAPMAAIYSQAPEHSTLFTDFTLDGSSDNFYFYGVRELGNQMQMGEFSPFLGPVKLVNTNPAEPAKIMSLLPVMEDTATGEKAKIRIEINAYPEVQKINKISVYRTDNKLSSESILDMKLIKTVDIDDVETDPENSTWIVYDEFEDMENKPYGDLMFYRVVVSRKVEYSTTDYNVMPPASQVIVEQAPSLASKVIVSTLIESAAPPAPELRYHSEPVESDVINWVILSWDQVCYKGKYHLYKMGAQGNWNEIARIDTDRKDTSKAHLYLLENDPVTGVGEWIQKETFDMTQNEFFLPLEKLNLDPMSIRNADGSILYHHFKMVAENTSDMYSKEEKILTIYREETWSDIGGISHDGTDGMILQGTFIVRPN